MHKMDPIRNIKGTKDILPEEAKQWQEIQSAIQDFMELHGYGEIRTPAFELTQLFTRGVGEDTDIVSKEMYSWTDQGGSNLTLKPELTAPVVRAYIQHNLAAQSPVTRLYYFDSLFRRERPQKGRQRQFNQFGIEAFGSANPEQDAEVISIAYRIWGVFGIKDLTLKLNTIGSAEIRPVYLKILREALSKHKKDLCPTCQNRIDTNALRVFDCKNTACQQLLDEHAPMITDHVSDDDKIHFEQVQDYLKAMDIPFILDKKMVRGLDYYTRTTFEITSPVLGAQDSLCGGGRYDGLVEQLGGKPTPGIGFAAGIERLILALSAEEEIQEIPVADVYLVTLGEKAITQSFSLADDIRRETGLRVINETLRRSMKAQMREANRTGALYAVILGDLEIENQKAVVKNMEEGGQDEVSFSELSQFFFDAHSHNCDCCNDHDHD